MLELKRLLPSGSVDLLFSHFCYSFLSMEQLDQHLPSQGGGTRVVDLGRMMVSPTMLWLLSTTVCFPQQGENFVQGKFP